MKCDRPTENIFDFSLSHFEPISIRFVWIQNFSKNDELFSSIDKYRFISNTLKKKMKQKSLNCPRFVPIGPIGVSRRTIHDQRQARLTINGGRVSRSVLSKLRKSRNA